MKSIVFDTETTGLPLKRDSSIYKTDEWPYIIQLSYIVYDHDSCKLVVSVNDYIAIDESIIIQPQSFEKHGLDHSFLQKNGIPITESIMKFKSYMTDKYVIVGHNVSFDKRMLLVECIRHKIHLNMKETFCTMKNSVELCKIETKNSKGETYYKYPKLEELHYYLFSHNMKNLHDASIDILVCLRCYVKMISDLDIVNINPHIKNLVDELRI
jgi:DNA polymerase III epsilon subunit-like protein